MAKQERIKTEYPGVYYVMGKAVSDGRPERIYYVFYRRDGRQVEEKVGRQFQDAMTPAKAARIRAERIEGKALSNQGRRDAEKAAREAEAGRWTLDRLWVEYKSHRNASHALRTDDSRFNKFLAPVFGDREPIDILTLDVDRLRVKLLKERSPQTVKHVLALLKRIILFGVRKGLCEAPNPKLLTITMPRVDNETTEDLDPEQLARLLQAIEDEPNIQAANFMRLALYTGMRRGELFKLRWEDLDFQRGFITIVAPKGGKTSKIPMSAMARRVLEGHPRLPGVPYVFPGKDGKRRVSIQVASNKIKARAGLPSNFRPLHGLRHVFASMLASSGEVDMHVLQSLLTHKSATMTKRYSHLRDDALKRAASVADDILGQIGNGHDKKVVNIKER